MPQRRTAIKDLRKAHTKHLHNLQIKTDLKKTVKKFTTAVSDKKADAVELLKEIYKKFDPTINQAIAEFNEELKTIAKKKLF